MRSTKIQESAHIDFCLLAQAAHWFFDGVDPIADEIYAKVPKTVDTDSGNYRELYIALCKSNAALKGDLIADWELHHPDDPYSNYEPIQFTPFLKIACDKKIEIFDFHIENIDFSESMITISDKFMHLSNHDLTKIGEEKALWGVDPNWTERLQLKNVSVEFEKFRTFFQQKDTSLSDPAARQAGRPQTYKWNAIWAEIAVRADLDNLPETQAECIRLIQEWYQNRFNEEPPSDSMLKEKLKLVYGHPRKKARN